MQPKREVRAVDLLDPELHGNDAWPLYDWLREEARVYWDPINEIWSVARYDDIIAVAKDPETFTSALGNLPKMPSDPSFINLDGREHQVRRHAVRHLFSAKAVAKLQDHITEVVDDLLDNIITSGTTDFVEDVAGPLPMRIVAEMTGIPLEYHDDVRRWLDVFMLGGNGPEAVTDEVNEAFINFGGLHMMLVEERLAEPKDDLLSLWIHSEFDGEKLDDDQLLFEHTMMMIGGSETTRNVISGGLEMLARNPAQRDWLIANPEGLSNAVDEMVRWVSPFVRFSRTALRDAEVGGTKISQGDEVIMLYPAGNRDPRKFEDPYSFDVRRSFTSKPISFGYGRHYCIGAHLAKLEAKVVLERVLARIPDFHLVGEPQWRRSSFIRGPIDMPFGFTPGKKR